MIPAGGNGPTKLMCSKMKLNIVLSNILLMMNLGTSEGMDKKLLAFSIQCVIESSCSFARK